MGWVTNWLGLDSDRSVNKSGPVAVPLNNPRLVRPTRMRVLKAFRVKGEPLPVGSETTIEYHLAVDLQHLGRCEILEVKELHDER